MNGVDDILAMIRDSVSGNIVWGSGKITYIVRGKDGVIIAEGEITC